MGQVIFALLLIAMLVQLYINFRHRHFERYMRLTHLQLKVESQEAFLARQQRQQQSPSLNIGSWFA